MIKLVATDIDGTLLIPEGQFTEGVKKCVQKLCQKGIKVVLVTGRMNAAASLIAEDAGGDEQTREGAPRLAAGNIELHCGEDHCKHCVSNGSVLCLSGKQRHPFGRCVCFHACHLKLSR